MAVDVELLKAYSEGLITRREIGERLGEPISFGQLLAALHEHDLKLHRPPVDPNSPGVELVRRLSSRVPVSGD